MKLPFFYGWLVVGVAFFTMAIGVNARSAFSLLYPPILAEFAWDRGATAAAFSVGFLSSTLYSPVIGRMMDRWGPRGVISLGAVLVGLGLVLTTFIYKPWHLYATLGVLVVGGSVSLSYTGHGAFVPNWFERRRGLAVGIAFSGVGLGAVVMFPWLQWLIDTHGWRAACWWLALIVVVLLVPINLAFQRQKPSDLGLLPDGDAHQVHNCGEAADSTNPTKPTKPARPTTPANVVDVEWAARDWTLAQAMRTRRFWYVFAGFVCGMISWYTAVVHQTQFLIDVGIDSARAALALGLVPLLGVVGQIGFGGLSDRIGREWGWTIGCAGFVLCYLALLSLGQSASAGMLIFMIVTQGLFGYALTPNFGAIPAEMFKGNHYGSIFGVLSAGAGIGAAIGPWGAGALYDWLGSYTVPFSLCIVSSVISCGFIWLARPGSIRRVAGRIR
ncbi:MAG: MFS transporter [Burkholderiaceae bacterium]